MFLLLMVIGLVGLLVMALPAFANHAGLHAGPTHGALGGHVPAGHLPPARERTVRGVSMYECIKHRVVVASTRKRSRSASNTCT